MSENEDKSMLEDIKKHSERLEEMIEKDAPRKIK